MPTKTKSAAKGKTPTRGATKAKTATKNGGGRRGGGAAFMKPMQPDEALAAVVGDEPQPRSEITKRIWDYVKKKKLQDAKDRRMINADDTLKPVFNGKKKVSMFELTKLVNEHLEDT